MWSTMNYWFLIIIFANGLALFIDPVHIYCTLWYFPQRKADCQNSKYKTILRYTLYTFPTSASKLRSYLKYCRLLELTYKSFPFLFRVLILPIRTLLDSTKSQSHIKDSFLENSRVTNGSFKTGKDGYKCAFGKVFPSQNYTEVQQKKTAPELHPATGIISKRWMTKTTFCVLWTMLSLVDLNIFVPTCNLNMGKI